MNLSKVFDSISHEQLFSTYNNMALQPEVVIVVFNKIQTTQKNIIKIILNRPRTYPSGHQFK